MWSSHVTKSQIPNQVKQIQLGQLRRFCPTWQAPVKATLSYVLTRSAADYSPAKLVCVHYAYFPYWR
ncbi:hypothetical protein PS2_002005 [Malus domestica]